MNKKTKHEQMRKFLDHVYDLHLQKQEINGLKDLYETYGVSKYTGMSLQRTQVIEKIEGRKGSYKWISSAQPNNVMIARTMKKNTKIGVGYTINKAQVAATKLIPLTEIKRNAVIEARSSLIKAARVADVLGIDILDLSNEKIDELISKIN